MSINNQRRPTDPGTHASPTGAEPPQQHHSGHGAHKWHMLLMCLPLIGFGLWSMFSGSGGGALIGGLLCAGMMLLMHGRPGSSHRH